MCVSIFERRPSKGGVRASWNAGTVPPSGADEIKGSNRSNRIWPQNHSAKRAIVFRSILSNSSPDRLAAN